MKKLLSLSLMLSLGLATVTPALNAVAQSQQDAVAQSQANPAHASGWQAAKKWWRSGRNMKALSKQEKKAFRALKRRFARGIIAAAMIAGGAALTIGYKKRQAGQEKFTRAQGKFKTALNEYIRVVTNENYTQEERHWPSHYEQKFFRATLRAVRENKESAFVSAYAEYKKAIKTFQTFLLDPKTEQTLNNELSGLESNAITFLKKKNYYRNPLLHYDLRTGNLVSVP